MREPHHVVALALLLAACGPPQRSPDVTPTRPADAAPADERPDVSKLTPVVLEPGVAIALPGTTLTATLVRSWYGERVVGTDAGASAAAELKVRAADGRSETVIVPFYRTQAVLGVRLYVDGGRDAVFLFVVP